MEIEEDINRGMQQRYKVELSEEYQRIYREQIEATKLCDFYWNQGRRMEGSIGSLYVIDMNSALVGEVGFLLECYILRNKTLEEIKDNMKCKRI